MFKSLSGLTDNAFWRVSSDTKTCGSPLYLSPAGGLCSSADKHAGILTYIQTVSTKKRLKTNFFWPPCIAARRRQKARPYSLHACPRLRSGVPCNSYSGSRDPVCLPPPPLGRLIFRTNEYCVALQQWLYSLYKKFPFLLQYSFNIALPFSWKDIFG